MIRAALLLSVLMSVLSACGGAGTSAPVAAPQPSSAPASPVATVPAPPLVGIWITAAVLKADSSETTASLRIASSGSLSGTQLSAQTLSVSVDSVPAGFSVQALAASSGPDGLTIPVAVQASGAGSLAGSVQTDAWLNVRLNGQTQRVRLPILRASSVTLPGVSGASGASVQVAASAPCGPDVLLSAPVNAPLEQRTRLLRLTAAGTVQSYDLGLAPTEGVTSQLCDPSGTIWLSIRSDDAQGSVIARLNPASARLERFPVGAVGDTVNNLTRTPDGRLWFVQYKRDRLGEFDPVSGGVTSHAVAENAENLRLGQDGALYYSQFYNTPAVVRFDPTSGSSRALSAGNSSKNLPRASVQTGGSVWYVDALAQSLNRIDLASGQTVQAHLPSGAAPGELVAAPDGTLWVADAARHLLYRLPSGSLDSVTVPLASGVNDGPRGLSVGPDGKLWYESGGQMVGQQ
ncbi:hypothetical protein [Deinococcus altitudinis]|uniref:Vgb family protein n=1 Tax=Deinococcus altitudinis TaxID=468914 RepID=UPI003891ABB4